MPYKHLSIFLLVAASSGMLILNSCTKSDEKAQVKEEVTAQASTDPAQEEAAAEPVADAAADAAAEPAQQPEEKVALEEAAPGDTATPSEIPVDPAAATDTTALQLPTAPTAPEPAVPSAQPAADAGQKRVWFVKQDKVVIRSAPDEKGKVVGRLAKGDHVLAVIEGEWANLGETRYVKADLLSDQPIGRGKKPAVKWNESTSH
jgi:hypothetical protein